MSDFETYCEAFGVADKPADLFKGYAQAVLLDSEFMFTEMIAGLGGNLNAYLQPTTCQPGQTLLDIIQKAIATTRKDFESTQPSEADKNAEEFTMLLKKELERHEPGSYKYFTYQLFQLTTNPPRYDSSKKVKLYEKQQMRLTRLLGIEKLLLNKGAKLWKELEPQGREILYNLVPTNPSSKSELILPDIEEYSALSHDGQNASQYIPKVLWPLYTELFEAVWSNDLKTVENLTLPTPDKKAPLPLLIAVKNLKGFTPFTLACYRGHAALAKMVLEIANFQYQLKEKQEVEFKKTSLNNYSGKCLLALALIGVSYDTCLYSTSSTYF